MSVSKTEFVCVICKKILKKATRLPCKCKSICESHLDDAVRLKKSDSFITCAICGKVFQINDHIFEADEIMQYKIDNTFHLDHQEIELKISIDKAMRDIFAHIDVFKEYMNEFSLVQCEHFLSLKNEIDIKRELLLQDLYERDIKEADREKIVHEIQKVNC